jgi:hypothetical protein
MADQNLTIGIRADASQLRADLALAQAQMRQAASDLRAVAVEAVRTGDASAVRPLADAFEQIRGKVSSIRTELAAVGGGGAGAFEGLRSAASGLSRELGPIGALIEAMTTGLSGLATAAGLAATALFEMSKHAAESTRQIENTAADLGLTAEKYESLKFAFTRAGASAEGFDRSMERLNASIAKGAEEQRKGVETTQKAADQVDKHRIELMKLEDAQKRLQEAVGTSASAIDKARDSYANSTVTAQKAADTFREYAASGKATSDAASGVGSAVHKLGEEHIAAQTAAGGATRAYEGINTAINAHAHAVEAARIGHEELLLKQRESNEEAYKAKTAWEKLGISLLDATGKTRELKDVFPEIVDGLAKMENAADRAQVLRELIGKGFAEMLPGLRQGNAEIERLGKMFEESGALGTAAEKKMAEAFNSSFATFTAMTEGLGRAIGNIAGQLFTGALDRMAKALMDNAQHIRDFAQSVVNVLTPAFSLIGRVIEGVLKPIGDLFAIFGSNAGTVAIFGGLILTLGTRIGLIIGIVVAAEKALRTLFGDEATARVLSWGIEIVGVVKALGMLRDAFVLLNVAAAPWIIAIGILVALGAALVLAFGPVKEISAFLHEHFGDTLGNAFDAFAKGFDDAILHIGEWMHEKFDALKQYLLDLFESAVQKITDFFQPLIDVIAGITKGINDIIGKGAAVKDAVTGGSAGAAAGGSSDNFAGTFATGGIVNGPSGRDRVPIWATAGEAVTRVAAVRHYGADLFHRLNNMQIPRFEMGGFVDAINPAPQHFSNGGIVAAGGAGSVRSAFTIVLDGQSFDAHSDSRTADSLERTARRRQMTSGGRKPSSYT